MCRAAGDGGRRSTVGAIWGPTRRAASVGAPEVSGRLGDGIAGVGGGAILGEGYLIGGTVRSVLGAADGSCRRDRYRRSAPMMVCLPGATVAVIDGDGDSFVNVVICGGDV